MKDCPVYRAERLAAENHPAFLALITAPQAWVDFVTYSEPFLRLRREAGLPSEYVTVTEGNSRTACLAYPKKQHIELIPGYTPAQFVLVHEVAHLCTPADAHHDRRFAANYLTLTKEWLGESAAAELLRAFREFGIL